MLLALTTLAAATLSATPQTYQLESSNKQSMASYTAVHKLHQFTGTSHDLTGLARALPDGTLQVQIRGPVGGFDSENGNRDEHMKETVEAAKFPDVTVKCLSKLSGNGNQKISADCDINLHGQSQKVTAPLDLTFSGAGKVEAKGTFSVSWDGFGIKRPQLLFVPINDQGTIVVDVVFTAK